jgi:hypothetical protein
MFKVKYNIHPDEITRIKQRLDALEANRPKAESDAAACSPAGNVIQTRRGVDKWLFYATIVLGVLFVGLSVTSLILSK